MENIYWGIIVVIVCCLGYLISFCKLKHKKYTLALSIIIVCGLILRVYASFDFFLHSWDERYHALVAKHLSAHFFTPTLYEQPYLSYDYKSWSDNHIWLHKQPLTLWLMAISLKIFGIHVWAIRVPSIILSTIGIKLVYDVAKYLYNREIAFTAAFLFSINGLIIDLAAGRTATDHVDIAFMFFVLVAIWFGMKNATQKQYRYAFLTGISLGCAILCKWMPALVVLPVWALIFYKRETNIRIILTHFSIILLTTVAVVLPWQLYIIRDFPREAYYEYSFNLRHYSEVLSMQGGNFLYHFDLLRQNYGELIYLPVLWLSFISFKKGRLCDTAILIWFWLPYLFFSFCATKMQAYTILSAPAVFIIAAKAFYVFKEYAHNNNKYRMLLIILAYGFILLPIRYSIDRIKPFSNIDRNPEWNKKIDAFAMSQQNTTNTIVFNCEHPIEMMFKTKCTCYYVIPDSCLLQKLKQEKINVIVLKN